MGFGGITVGAAVGDSSSGLEGETEVCTEGALQASDARTIKPVLYHLEFVFISRS
jgi:hypothetical protein